jgi:FdhE protein
LSRLTLETWLAAHPYLEPLARLAADLDAAAEAAASPCASTPDFEAYREDYRAGIPLLESPSSGLDLAPVEALVAAVAGSGDARPGFARAAGWGALARWLAPVASAFEAWRDEEAWMRPHCPMCGSAPALAQLLGTDPGRMRFLVCGCCRTRWRYSRTACPFCEKDDRRLNVLAVDGEAGLRLDVCEACTGYLKTYDGQGDEDVLLLDWTSLHLDVLAQDRGLERRAASLWSLEAGLPAAV